MKISGYRELSEDEIATINGFKVAEAAALNLLDAASAAGLVDARWAAIGRTQLEQAFMAINRSIAKPQRVEVPDA